MQSLGFVFYFLFVLVGVAYLTLFEHYFLALVQGRLGPGKVIFSGMIQPILDGFKLMQKEFFLMDFLSIFFYFFLPFFKFILSLLFFLFYLNLNTLFDFIFFFLMIGFMTYFFLLVSFFSKSKYSMLGSIRLVVQTLSFDMVFLIFLLSFIFFLKSMSFLKNFWFFLFFFILNFLILVILVELNRTPFDFAEGESELVSGYNLELGSIFFVYFFLSEYILFLFYVFWGGKMMICFSFLGGLLFFIFILGLRGVLPRFRYDFLLGLFWFILLIFIFFLIFLVFLIVSMNFKFLNSFFG